MKNLILVLSILSSVANAQVHCVGENAHTRLEITLSDSLRGEARESDLNTGRAQSVYFNAVLQPRTRASRVDFYSEDPSSHIGWGFGLGIRNETGYGSLILAKSPLGHSFRDFAVQCDRF